MFIRGYLRASTSEQDASRARQQLVDFAREHGHVIASWYVDNASGATTQRPELLRLLSDAQPGDVILIEAVDRLSRLSLPDWQQLRGQIDSQGLRVVSLDLPTSHTAMTMTGGDDFTGRMLDALNRMMLDVLAAVARKDYEDRRHRQRQGIEKAREEGKYAGRKKNHALRQRIAEMLAASNGQGGAFSIRDIATMLGCSPTTVKAVKAELAASPTPGDS